MNETPVTPPHAALPQRFIAAGALILAIGLACAGYVYWSAVDDSAEQLAQDMIHGKQYDFQLERMGGKAMVLMAQFNDWFGSLWHGKPLAAILAGTSLVVGLGCIWVGRRLAVLARGVAPASAAREED
ncbi:MAG TPA: hypothetical protein VH105_19645 [Burkholderiales bacterium]|jgi:hypothetical protein|nr:hypothetical protein [Burkholderiales bacterium]